MSIRPEQVVRPPVPQAGGIVSRSVGRLLFSLAGWRMEGRLPDLPKFVICVAPHTSNWDFVIGYAAKMGIGLRASWLGKHTLFRGPLGPIFRSMGGIATNRSAAHGVVEQVADRIARSDQLVLAVAPEGTRRRVERWKTGFYRIAHAAHVPIVPVALDWGTSTVRIGQPFEPTGDLDADLPVLYAFIADARGKQPGNAYPPPAG